MFLYNVLKYMIFILFRKYAYKNVTLMLKGCVSILNLFAEIIPFIMNEGLLFTLIKINFIIYT